MKDKILYVIDDSEVTANPFDHRYYIHPENPSHEEFEVALRAAFNDYRDGGVEFDDALSKFGYQAVNFQAVYVFNSEDFTDGGR